MYPRSPASSCASGRRAWKVSRVGRGWRRRWGHSCGCTWCGGRGTVLDALRMKEAIAEGGSQFDVGRGDEAYKSGYGTRVEGNTRVLLATGDLRSRVAYAMLLAHIRQWARVARTGLTRSEAI